MIQILKVKAIQVEVEVFGKIRTLYTVQNDFEYILNTIQLINGTAHLRSMVQVEVVPAVLEKDSLEQVVEAHQRYINEYKLA